MGEPFERARDGSSSRPRRKAGRRGDFLITAAFSAQSDQQSIATIELADGAHNRLRAVAGIGSFRCDADVAFREPCQPSPSRTLTVTTGMRRHGEDPPASVRQRSATGEMSQEAQEGFLDDVFGICGPAEHQQGEAEHAVAVLGKQPHDPLVARIVRGFERRWGSRHKPHHLYNAERVEM